jgi:hypothetical protein
MWEGVRQECAWRTSRTDVVAQLGIWVDELYIDVGSRQILCKCKTAAITVQSRRKH